MSGKEGEPECVRERVCERAIESVLRIAETTPLGCLGVFSHYNALLLWKAPPLGNIIEAAEVFWHPE